MCWCGLRFEALAGSDSRCSLLGGVGERAEEEEEEEEAEEVEVRGS